MAITQNDKIIQGNLREWEIWQALQRLPSGQYNVESAPRHIVARFVVENNTVQQTQ
jgi:hypothetical protein